MYALNFLEVVAALVAAHVTRDQDRYSTTSGAIIAIARGPDGALRDALVEYVAGGCPPVHMALPRDAAEQLWALLNSVTGTDAFAADVAAALVAAA